MEAQEKAKLLEIQANVFKEEKEKIREEVMVEKDKLLEDPTGFRHDQRKC